MPVGNRTHASSKETISTQLALWPVGASSTRLSFPSSGSTRERSSPEQSAFKLGVCGIDSDFGLSADDLQAAHLKRAMSRAAEKTLALASREKIGRRARYQAVALNELTSLITDAAPAEVAGLDSQTLEIIHA